MSVAGINGAYPVSELFHSQVSGKRLRSLGVSDDDDALAAGAGDDSSRSKSLPKLDR